MDHRVVPTILCGGAGTRLWPFSRQQYPKPFIRFDEGETLFAKTVKRVKSLAEGSKVSFSEPIVVCNQEHRFLAQRDLLKADCDAKIITEPFAKNTAPAIAFAAFEALKVSSDAILFVTPSDHVIKGKAILLKAGEEAVELAQKGYIVTFGIQPTAPKTEFGYIAAGDHISRMGFAVERFVEKPVLEKAREMLEVGNFYWNSGMFVVRAQVYLDALKEFAPEIYDACRKAMEGAQKIGPFLAPDAKEMTCCPSDSIDYAVMEKTTKAAVVPLHVTWSDLGSWSAMHEEGHKDDEQNVSYGDVMSVACSNCYLRSSGRLLVAIGLSDVVAVETSDAVLVSKLSRTQDLKKVVEKLESTGRIEADNSPVVHRPWGTYESIARGDHYQSKRIVVNPRQALSLQLHHHRSEHWTIVEGKAEVILGDETKQVQKNESVYIPKGTIHRLKNNSDQPVVLIEVQCGEYLGEDDIVRLDDVYFRN